MTRIFFVLFVVLGLVGTLHASEVKNLESTQVGNRVLFEFDVVGEEEETDVTVTLTVNDKEYKEKDLHLEGDYMKVKIGTGRKIYWNVLQDFPRGYQQVAPPAPGVADAKARRCRPRDLPPHWPRPSEWSRARRSSGNCWTAASCTSFASTSRNPAPSNAPPDQNLRGFSAESNI